jgi:hypothetical protein
VALVEGHLYGGVQGDGAGSSGALGSPIFA